MADGWMGMEVGMGVWECPMHACTHMHVKHAKHACCDMGHVEDVGDRHYQDVKLTLTSKYN